MSQDAVGFNLQVMNLKILDPKPNIITPLQNIIQLLNNIFSFGIYHIHIRTQNV